MSIGLLSFFLSSEKVYQGFQYSFFIILFSTVYFFTPINAAANELEQLNQQVPEQPKPLEQLVRENPIQETPVRPGTANNQIRPSKFGGSFNHARDVSFPAIFDQNDMRIH